ncbi:AAA family ATPase [Roseisolibacter sp. H3M3-2]|uniref:AAA family ATPase n=1 Tax=Roseisolibacter sp. H3M3-2 TaxID=3031323 RepID=UPI0023DB7D2D|nr:AAA family ATPase [Roseisolibacter sp. H3M3-2]MDF1502227.1 AAA family ATPase [Roseisolibacter sp. H3M3-2]
MSHHSIPLAPAQQRALDALVDLPPGPAVLVTRPGMGRSTLLRAVHRALGGTLLGASDLTRALDARHPLAVEEALHRLLADALAEHEVVLVDDFHLAASPLLVGHFYPRNGLARLPLAALGDEAARRGRRLVVASDPGPLAGMWPRARTVALRELAVEDYAHFLRDFLGEAGARVDAARVHRFARQLSARQLRVACDGFAPAPAPGGDDTERFVAHLRAHHVASNVDLGEVQAVALSELKGVDDVVAALEASIVLPFERADLAATLGLTPRRGVLLVGPPGTGKTTVGRALAHRLRGKFFLIDGTVVAGTPAFYHRLHKVVEAAKENAPAVIFIDDSDVIFEGGGDAGFYRYLLTLLDGLESESAGRVCVMMTAMDVASLPPALVRSGRVELWLEMRLPDEAARAAILGDRVAALPDALRGADVARVAAETEGLSGADLKRLVEDAKLLYAYDLARDAAPADATDYLVRAVGHVRENRRRYLEAEAHARARRAHQGPAHDGGGFVTTSGIAFADGDGMAVSHDFVLGDDGEG